MRDFTHRAYRDLLETLRASGYGFHRFERLAAGTPPEPFVLLRHDVDRLPHRAFALARLEHAVGIPATYFFRARRGAFAPRVIAGVRALGHEIGYHYETLCDAKGDPDRALLLFQEALRRFEPFGGAVSAAAHGRPISRWDPRAMWNVHGPRAAGIRVEAERDVDWSRTVYVTDTGGAWNHEANRRDRPAATTTPGLERVRTTRELLRFLEATGPPRLVISAHPERWTIGRLAWLQARGTDRFANAAKRLLTSGGSAERARRRNETCASSS